MDLELNKATATAGLSAPARRMQLIVLRCLAETGKAPARSELVRIADHERVDAHAVLRADRIGFFRMRRGLSTTSE